MITTKQKSIILQLHKKQGERTPSITPEKAIKPQDKRAREEERNREELQNQRHRVAEWIKKQDPSKCCVQENRFRGMDTQRQKVEG